MIERDRILSKVAELDGYLRELDSIRPANRAEFEAVEKRRDMEWRATSDTCGSEAHAAFCESTRISECARGNGDVAASAAEPDQIRFSDSA